LVLGWNFLIQVGFEIRCAGHEIIIPARNRHKEWLEEKLSVAVGDGEENIKEFLEAELTAAWITFVICNISKCFGPSDLTELAFAYQDDIIVIKRTQQEHKENLIALR